MFLKCVTKPSIPLRSVFQRNIKTSSIQYSDNEKSGQDEKSDKKINVEVEEVSKKEKNLYEHLEIDPSGNLFNKNYREIENENCFNVCLEFCSPVCLYGCEKFPVFTTGCWM